jgi:hypothetical protein
MQNRGSIFAGGVILTASSYNAFDTIHNDNWGRVGGCRRALPARHFAPPLSWESVQHMHPCLYRASLMHVLLSLFM